MAFKIITVGDLKSLMAEKEIAIVDVRDAMSFDQNHIEKAVHLHDGNIDFFLDETEREKPVVVYCFHGHSSKGAANYLDEQGFAEVFSLEGGYTAWQSFVD
ncbi:MAG: thiosulfate sulfurtransferase GlpE [Pseudomonadales bacterium]|nr:thiosulfate sulfurtransferase GlpE [Pseudomonadales bacterium]